MGDRVAGQTAVLPPNKFFKKDIRLFLFCCARWVGYKLQVTGCFL
jgi:hypothetical protein